MLCMLMIEARAGYHGARQGKALLALPDETMLCYHPACIKAVGVRLQLTSLAR